MQVYHDLFLVPGSRSTFPDTDPDPDTGQWYGSDRIWIRIRNTAFRSKYFESKKLFFCRLTEECAFVTESIKIIQQHEKYHQQDNRKQCGKCSVFFESRSILKDHAKTCCFDKFIARIDALKVSLGMVTIKKEPRRPYEAPSLSCTHQVKGCAQMFSDRRILHDHASKCEFRPKKFGTCHVCIPARSYFYEKDYNDHFNKKHPKSRASKSRTTTPNPRHPSQKSRSTSRDQGHPLRPPYSTRATTPESRELRHESHSNNSRSWTPVQSEMSGSRPMPTPSDVRIHPRSLGPSIRRSRDEPGASARRLSRDDPWASVRRLSHDRPGASRDHQRDLFDNPPENRLVKILNISVKKMVILRIFRFQLIFLLSIYLIKESWF